MTLVAVAVALPDRQEARCLFYIRWQNCCKKSSFSACPVQEKSNIKSYRFCATFAVNSHDKIASRSLLSQIDRIQQLRGMARSCECGGDPCKCTASALSRADVVPSKSFAIGISLLICQV